MSNIFLSYASEDRPRVAHVASALSERGWSVYWDRDIPSGQIFLKVITEELDGAECVLVFWSAASVSKEWVIDEASHARRRKTLIPIMFDDVDPPLGFRQIQAVNLVAWDGNTSAPSFVKLLGDISGLLAFTASAKNHGSSVPVNLMAVITGTIDQKDRHLIEAIVSHLRKVSEDASLTLVEVRKGSIVLLLQCSQAGFARLRELRMKGELNSVLGLPLENLVESKPISLDTHKGRKKRFREPDEGGQRTGRRLAVAGGGRVFGYAAAVELWNGTISQIPHVIGRLVYMSALCNPHSGIYQHFDFAQRFSDREADRVIRESHKNALSEWLSLSLEQQKADLEHYLRMAVGEMRADLCDALANMNEWPTYLNWIPSRSRAADRELFRSDLEIVISQLYEEYRARVRDDLAG